MINVYTPIRTAVIKLTNQVPGDTRLQQNMHTPHSGRCIRATDRTDVVLTEGGGGVSSDGAGHEEVGNLAQGEEAGWVISLIHLFLDQTFQLVLERLRYRKSTSVSTRCLLPSNSLAYNLTRRSLKHP